MRAWLRRECRADARRSITYETRDRGHPTNRLHHRLPRVPQVLAGARKMDGGEKNLKWQELLRLEREARGSAYELRKEGASPSEMRKPLQIWWLTVSDVFHVYQVALSLARSLLPWSCSPSLRSWRLTSPPVRSPTVLPMLLRGGGTAPVRRKRAIWELPSRTCWRPVRGGLSIVVRQLSFGQDARKDRLRGVRYNPTDSL